MIGFFHLHYVSRVRLISGLKNKYGIPLWWQYLPSRFIFIQLVKKIHDLSNFTDIKSTLATRQASSHILISAVKMVISTVKTNLPNQQNDSSKWLPPE